MMKNKHGNNSISYLLIILVRIIKKDLILSSSIWLSWQIPAVQSICHQVNQNEWQIPLLIAKMYFKRQTYSRICPKKGTKNINLNPIPKDILQTLFFFFSLYKFEWGERRKNIQPLKSWLWKSKAEKFSLRI